MSLFEEEDCDCLNSAILKADDICAYISDCCDDFESNFNFYSLFYCSANHNYGMMVPFVIIIILCFYLLGSTADEYLSPALETLAVKLHISESLAGVTFLALGNGAPDVISALSASGGDDGIYLAIGALLGAGLFVSGVVAATVTLSSPKPIKVVPKEFLRDTGFYMLGPLILTIAAATGKISYPFIASLLVVYLIFIIVVVISDRMDKKVEKEIRLQPTRAVSDSIDTPERREEEKEALIPELGRFDQINRTESLPSPGSDEPISVVHDPDGLKEDSMHDLHFEEQDVVHEEMELKFDSNATQDPDYTSKLSPQVSNGGRGIQRFKHKMVWSLVKMNKFAYKTIQGESSWEEMNFIQKIVFILIDAPFGFLRRLTVPPSNDEQWDRRFAVLFPICSVIFFYLVSGLIDFSGPPPIHFYVLLGIGLILSIITYYRTKQQHAPEKFIVVFALLAFVMSLVWIWFIANILIDVLSLLGVVFSLKPAFLGVTVLAWGNSIGDMIANLSISKKGFAKMAMTGCIAGPLFNLFFGLGVSLVKEAINGNISKYTFHSSDSILPNVCGALLFGNLLFLFITSIFSGFVLRRWMSIIQIIYFVASIAFLSVLAFTVD